MNINCLDFNNNNIIVYKPKKLNNNLIIFPIKYKKNSVLLKSPYLGFPKGIQNSTFSNKQFITLLFPDIFTKKHIQFYQVLLKLNLWLNDNVNKLIQHVNKLTNLQLHKKMINIKKIIDDETFYEPRLTMNLYKNCILFDNNNNPISSINSINCNTTNFHGKALFMISCIWFYQNQFGFTLHGLQLKFIPKIIKCFLNDNNREPITITEKNQTIDCPYCNETILLNNCCNNNNNNDQYKPFLKMKQVGVPLMAIKLKIQQQQLDYKQFLYYIEQNSKKEKKNPLVTIRDLIITKKNKLKKNKKKIKKKIIKQKYQKSNYKVPSLQEILSSLHSLKPIKK